MLASGAHVKIGTQEARIAFEQDNAYKYAAPAANSDVAYWLMDDWSGGEGNDVYDPTDEIVYDQGNVNARRIGVLTPPPTQGSFTTGALSPVPTQALVAAAGSRLYVIGEGVSAGATSYWYTTNMTSFVEDADAWNAGVDRIRCVNTDGKNLYIIGQDTAFASGSFQIRMLKGSDGTTSDLRTYAATPDPDNGPWAGCGVLNGYLYYWNGNLLYNRKISDGTSADERLQYTFSGGIDADVDTLGSDYWAGMVNGEGSLFFFLGQAAGTSTIFETDSRGVTAAIWTMAPGFTAKSMCYQSGAIVIVGEYLGRAAAFGMSTLSRQPLFLGFIRYGSDFDPEICAPGYGTEVIIAEKDAFDAGGNAGRVFIYDIGQDAFTQLDVISHASGEIWGAGVFGGKRFVTVQDGNDMNIYHWTTDDSPSTTVNGRMESGAWDMDLPEDEKQLDGFHVISDANSTKTVDVYYQDNEDGTWTLAGTATTGHHNYIQVSNASSTVKFRTLRVRVDPKAGATVYGISTRYRVNTYEESWELLLDLTDEEVDGPPGRKRRSVQDRGWQLRDYLRDIADNKTVVTFQDGARYPADQRGDPDKYSSHTVVVDILYERLERPGEGQMLVRLRSVDAN